MDLEIFKILYRLNYSAFYFVQYYHNVTTVLELHFSRLLSSKAYFKVCFEMGKIWLPFFSCQSLQLGTSVPNDTIQICMIYMYIKVRVLVKSSGELMIARCLGKLAIALAL